MNNNFRSQKVAIVQELCRDDKPKGQKLAQRLLKDMLVRDVGLTRATFARFLLAVEVTNVVAALTKIRKKDNSSFIWGSSYT